MKEYAHIYYPSDSTTIKGLRMDKKATFGGQSFNVAEPIAAYIKQNSNYKLTKEIIQSALCEALDKSNLVSIYNEVILSPEENKVAASLSRHLEPYTYNLLIATPPGPNGLIDIHTVKMTSVYGALLIQRLDDV